MIDGLCVNLNRIWKILSHHQNGGYYLHHHVHVIELVIEVTSQHEGLEVFIELARFL